MLNHRNRFLNQLLWNQFLWIRFQWNLPMQTQLFKDRKWKMNQEISNRILSNHQVLKRYNKLKSLILQEVSKKLLLRMPNLLVLLKENNKMFRLLYNQLQRHRICRQTIRILKQRNRVSKSMEINKTSK